MLEDLIKRGEEAGLEINMQKNEIITNNGTTEEIEIERKIVELVDKTVYLDWAIRSRDTSQYETERRISLRWKKYGTLGRIFKRRCSNRVKIMVFNANVVSVVTYEAQTWTLSKQMENKIKVTQNTMER